MKVLLDHCVPRPLRRHLPGHSVKTAYQMDWALVKNGDYLEIPNPRDPNHASH